ncbi:MAG TPA: hypothetical protein VHP58_06245 [Alphaproteobacteria bacterium]|nr:hypothetical protein [Alphaproteobacteria bacterium]
MNPQNKKLIIAAAVILVVFALGYAWNKQHHPAVETPLNSPLLSTVPDTGTPAATPAEMVSDTTFDIVSPSTQPVATTVSEAMPGSSGQ